MERVWPLLRRHGFDALIVLLTITAVLEVFLLQRAGNAPEVLWLQAAAIGIIVLPLAARHRFRFGGPIAYWLVAIGISFVEGRLIPFNSSLFLLTMAVAFLLGGLGRIRESWPGLAVVLGGAAIVVYNLPTHTTAQLVFIPLLFGVAWFAGLAMRQRGDAAAAAEGRAAQAERDREVAARIAVAEERARIARELHDIVAHAVSVMVLQTGAVRHRLPDGFTEEQDALRVVEETGRRALSEMRYLLEALRRDDEPAELGPQPGLERLDALLKEFSGAGLPVRLHESGERVPLPGPIDLAAYRIVQEGLTNALKHARAGHADVTVEYAPRELRLEVMDDGGGPQDSDGLGHGLVGIRERVNIYGGELHAGAGPDGGFLLSARLPLRE